MIGRPSGPNSFCSKGRGEPFERVTPNINITLIFIKDKSTIKQLYFYYWKLIFQQSPAQSPISHFFAQVTKDSLTCKSARKLAEIKSFWLKFSYSHIP